MYILRPASDIYPYGQPFGARPWFYGAGGHNGVDIPMPKGARIVAAHPGNAVYVSKPKSYGNYITLYGRGATTLYGHLLKPVKVGNVNRGDLIALADSTGISTGQHLHFTLWWGAVVVDPVKYIGKNMLTTEEVAALYKTIYLRDASASELKFWTSKELTDFLDTVRRNAVKVLD